MDLLIGADLIDRLRGDDDAPAAMPLRDAAAALRDESLSLHERSSLALDEIVSREVEALARALAVSTLDETATDRRAHPASRDPIPTARHARDLAVMVDPPQARFSAWYEVFPRSCAAERGRHGTFRDVIARLPYIAGMGFDVLYLPPIHPIGRTHRKGRNNAVRCEPGDVGSPWAIGALEGGHKAIHPDLGTLDDFRSLVRAAEDHGLSVALDVAFQCSPDHPYVREHPEWFRHRPDGTIQYAENPPKKYQDIYPLNFDTPAWSSLWTELRSVFTYWIDQGVSIFRVDNPHTKPLPFWEWCIGSIKREHPEVIFLSEAFTRPKVMYALAKIGFTQSYTYFTWRNTRWELEQYFTELTAGGSETPTGAAANVREFFRPNVWPNTPDILHEHLQGGGRPAFIARLVLAATLSANYGIYGPAFELCEREPREPGSEEYLNSEKYEIRHWELDRPGSLAPLIARMNAIRRENPALQDDWSLCFHRVDAAEEAIICYSKRHPGAAAPNIIITAVNLDPFHTRHGWVELPLEDFGIAEDEPFVVHDLLTDARYTWRGPWNYLELNPFALPAHVFRVERGHAPA
jgi:starch synthase (maltosyl-transferring)